MCRGRVEPGPAGPVIRIARRHHGAVTLRRFWFEFVDEGDGCRLPFGCGVTAETQEEALSFVADTYLAGRRPVVRKVVEDVDVGELAEELEQLVRPLRLGAPTVPGIWYPNLAGP